MQRTQNLPVIKGRKEKTEHKRQHERAADSSPLTWVEKEKNGKLIALTIVFLRPDFHPDFVFFNTKPVFNSQKKIPEYLKARYVITAARGL